MTTMIIIIIAMYPLLGIWVRIDVLFKHPAFGSMTTHTSTVAIHLIYPIMYHLLSSLSLSLDLLISTKKNVIWIQLAGPCRKNHKPMAELTAVSSDAAKVAFWPPGHECAKLVANENHEIFTMCKSI